MRKASDRQFLWWKVQLNVQHLGDKMDFVRRASDASNEQMLLNNLERLERSIEDIRRILEVSNGKT